ncbi:disease resistance protein L6 [Physcomitrium patens]|uniref:disease resistance protein L6 n=1 Tax=Physcomitrium patens TaxID=3218 RepID=UPI000D174248|nr:TMV resistance protein N-like [Physcomitrium patens]|eukprot:XP_024393012.1 TMV resistance protein N-like [Physcomitrella patens]
MLKKKIMSGVVVVETKYYGISKNNGYENIELQQLSKKVFVPKPIFLNEVDMVEEEVLGRNQCLLQISNLCISKVKALCLVGMGGIGKTTIAKTTLNNVKHMYDASCFIECDESTSDCYQSLCHILEQLKVEAKPKDLKESQKMLKLFLSRKRVIIVFDNVINQNQIEDVVPMDDLFSMSGSTLIVTTQNGEVMEHCGIELCKINIEELDEETRLRLFITHSCGHEGKLPNELVEVGKKIVKACNGLPLSLKVMGAYLRDKKRLRCWERAFQRLKRGRELDGDEKNSDYKIWNILRVSFDNLRVEEKKMFLDICCFFNNDVFLEGMLKERALRIWSNIEEKRAKEDMEYTLNTLINQSLIKVHKYGVIRVHDQLRDMGRKIVETEIEYTNTRMWNMNEEVSDGINEKLEGLCCNNVKGFKFSEMKSACFSSLRLLICNDCDVTSKDDLGRFLKLTTHLVNLRCFVLVCPRLTSLPNELGNLTSLTTIDI